MLRISCWIRGLFLVLVFSAVCSGALASQVADESALSTRRGALLYDKWYAGQAAPEVTHPLYPESGGKQGSASWRCKECHGWDYVGASGRYAQGSHYTGIAGVLQVRDWPADRLQDVLSSGAHDFSAALTASDLQALANFLRQGTMDVSRVIDTDGKASGSAAAGKSQYGLHCSSCHGDDGNKLDFKGKKAGVQGVGWLARDNPQESLHKIRWGHPGSDMPSMVVDAGLSEQQIADLLTYAQQLP